MTTKMLTLALALLPVAATLTASLAPVAVAQSECREFYLDASVYVSSEYCVGAPPSVFVMACSEFASDTLVTNTVNHVVGCRVLALP